MEDNNDNTKYFALIFVALLIIGIGLLALKFMGVI
jgi:hypothetical protein